MRIKDIDGMPVINAKRPLTLHVTKGDIARADIKEPADCAVARACRRELHVKEARIHLGRIYLRTNDSSWTRYLTPKTMRAEIIAFDRGGTFEPGTFVLPAPNPAKRAAGKRQGGSKPFVRGKSGKKRRSPHVVTNVRGGPA